MLKKRESILSSKILNQNYYLKKKELNLNSLLKIKNYQTSN